MLKSITLAAAVIAAATTSGFTEDRHSAVSPAEIYDIQSRDKQRAARISWTDLSVAHVALAARTKVSAADYTHSEIVQMLAARGTANKSVISVAMDKIAGKTPRPSGHTSPGEEALAREMGVDAADYTLSELAEMKFLRDN